MQLYSGLLSRAIRSIAESKEEKDLDTLFTGPKTTALVNPIAGLDDFELIAFLVIEDPNPAQIGMPEHKSQLQSCTRFTVR